jgi:hypothetical protein
MQKPIHPHGVRIAARHPPPLSFVDSRFLDVDRYGVLRVPALVWVSLALLARYWVLLAVVAVSVRRNSEAMGLLGHDGLSYALMAMELPAFAVALAAARRVPEAGRAMRLLWRRGRELMALTVVANLAWTGTLLFDSGYWSLWPELFLASCCLLDVAIVSSMYTNPVFRQLFREFPSPPATEEKEGAPP